MYCYDIVTKTKKEKYKNDSFPISTWENLGRRWTLLILKDLKENNTLRFNDFKKYHPEISNTILSNRLQKLRELGLINKKVSFDDKLLIEYELTESGTELIRFFDAFSLWALKLEKSKNH